MCEFVSSLSLKALVVVRFRGCPLLMHGDGLGYVVARQYGIAHDDGKLLTADRYHYQTLRVVFYRSVLTSFTSLHSSLLIL